MAERSPTVVVLAGPNGAGKSTSAPSLLQGTLEVPEFVNADTIARGLCAFDPGRVAIASGRIMLRRIRELADSGSSFAFETTLASRLFAPWLAELVESGYRFCLVFLWLHGADLAVQRVAERVKGGGHAVPEDVVRRRYDAGLKNFFELYRPLAGVWRVYDNSSLPGQRLVAVGQKTKTTRVLDEETWRQIVRGYAHDE